MRSQSNHAPVVPGAFQHAQLSLPHEIVIIATWADDQADEITIQDFRRDGDSFIPIFSDEESFDRDLAGTPFATSGVVIKTDLFLSMMRGGELLILDAGSPSPTEIRLPQR